MDDIKSRARSGVALLAATAGGKVTFICQVTSDLANRLHAGKIVREAAQITGGSGGGKPERAQAGGRDPSKLDEALAATRTMIGEALGRP
jgi:alanyl-tRNA synthetase